MAEDERAKVEARLESAGRTLRDALDAINNDSNLTPEGMAKREALRRDLDAIERDLEAVRQEHRPS